MRRLILAAVVVLFGVGQVEAVPIICEFSGSVTGVNVETGPEFDASISIGTVVTGRYTFDSELSSGGSSSEMGGFVPVGLFEATVGNYTLTSLYDIAILNDFGSNSVDRYEARSRPSSSFTNGTDNFTDMYWNLSFQDETGTMLSLPSDTVPLIELPGSGGLTHGHMWIRVPSHAPNASDESTLHMAIDSLSVTVIPEPSSIILWCTLALTFGGVGYVSVTLLL